MSSIHELSVIEKGATLGKNITIGPFCTIGQNVTLGDDVVIHSNVSISGHTTIGKGTEIFPSAAIGYPPQDLKFQGEDTEVIIGNDCKIREHVTIHPGTKDGGGKTTVGDHCLLMVGVHIAHDCHLANNVVMANCATLAGHVTVGESSILGGLSAILQFVRIGKNTMVTGMSGVRNDVPPFGLVVGNHAKISGINVIGLKRHGFKKDNIREIKNLYDLIFFESSGTYSERVSQAKDYIQSEHGEEVINFLCSPSKKNICQPKRS